jgi:tripartite-type tricarboxylate transporter receptor subunit TctC
LPRPAAHRSRCIPGLRWWAWPARRRRCSQLQHDILGALGTYEVRSRAEQAGFEITPSTPQALRERIEADVALYEPLVREGRVARM